MFEKLKEIFEGHRNHLLPPKKLKELITEVSNNRLAICKPCEHNSTKDIIKGWSYCHSCGCPLIQKSKSLQSSCPVGKWGPITTPEEEENIKLLINGQKNSKEDPPMEAPNSN